MYHHVALPMSTAPGRIWPYSFHRYRGYHHIGFNARWTAVTNCYQRQRLDTATEEECTKCVPYMKQQYMIRMAGLGKI
ncbi:hypothetical protein BDZ91DRAFT_555872 [Kalaharituber pfeilii]|nr:hypothetical protein BDZ91DRAFT_555872 [Kalaharituber pfeilii]